MQNMMAAAMLSAESAAQTFDIGSVMENAVSTTQGQIFTVLGIVVPAIVLIVGAIVGVRFGINWLKRIKG